jgi:hypothetical protein
MSGEMWEPTDRRENDSCDGGMVVPRVEDLLQGFWK